MRKRKLSAAAEAEHAAEFEKRRRLLLSQVLLEERAVLRNLRSDREGRGAEWQSFFLIGLVPRAPAAHAAIEVWWTAV